MATSNNNDTTSRGTKRARDDTAEGNEASSSQQAGVKRPRTSFPEPPSSGTAIPPTSSKSKVDTNAFQSSQVPSTSTPASPSIPNVNLPSKPKPLTRSRPIYHHPTLWFEDGDIIFQLRNLRYRVHRAKLAEHISYFDDMFSLPQPQQNQRASRKGKAKEIEPEEVVLEDGVEDEDDFELVLWWIYVGR
ncbi:hypothetical protein JAAARDRAFT_429916 [Jaapia argillacea MUCL 33604]|uniref:BTB domain-containing protein n=1 Tax=Jaapia argillacea MUCL 33604 TaxID=933084 RepID=A0A067PQL6_9AGAM|nr:hypothetical protein JAAARDRAFT_429916 [Jaapia argillacea MUCL 33604]